MKFIVCKNAHPEMYDQSIAIDTSIIISVFTAENEEQKKVTVLFAGDKGIWHVLDEFETVVSFLNG